MKERDKFLAEAILFNMSEELKDHYYELLTSHNKSVNSFRGGTFLTIPSIEVKFVQAGYVDLQNLPGEELKINP